MVLFFSRRNAKKQVVYILSHQFHKDRCVVQLRHETCRILNAIKQKRKRQRERMEKIRQLGKLQERKIAPIIQQQNVLPPDIQTKNILLKRQTLYRPLLPLHLHQTSIISHLNQTQKQINHNKNINRKNSVQKTHRSCQHHLAHQ